MFVGMWIKENLTFNSCFQSYRMPSVSLMPLCLPLTVLQWKGGCDAAAVLLQTLN